MTTRINKVAACSFSTLVKEAAAHGYVPVRVEATTSQLERGVVPDAKQFTCPDCHKAYWESANKYAKAHGTKVSTICVSKAAKRAHLFNGPCDYRLVACCCGFRKSFTPDVPGTPAPTNTADAATQGQHQAAKNATCLGIKADNTQCQYIAKANGYCGIHQNQAMATVNTDNLGY